MGANRYEGLQRGLRELWRIHFQLESLRKDKIRHLIACASMLNGRSRY